MSILAILAVILLLAFMVESLTEYFFGQLAANIPALKPYSWLLIYVAAAVGVLGAFVYKFDLLSLLGGYLQVNIPIGPFGIAITGAAIGRGSNYIHDIISKFFVKSNDSKVPS